LNGLILNFEGHALGGNDGFARKCRKRPCSSFLGSLEVRSCLKSSPQQKARPCDGLFVESIFRYTLFFGA
jgi:hypothetical protein